MLLKREQLFIKATDNQEEAPIPIQTLLIDYETIGYTPKPYHHHCTRKVTAKFKNTEKQQYLSNENEFSKTEMQHYSNYMQKIRLMYQLRKIINESVINNLSVNDQGK